MFEKRNFYIFMSLIITSTTLYPQNHEATPFILFLKKLSYVMWHSFFFVPKILGALFMGNGLYIVQALILFACMIAIESYSLHRFIKVPCRSVVPHMIFINFINIFTQWLAAYPLFYFIDLHKYLEDFYLKAYAFYGLTIIASCILLICRTIVACIIYGWFDKSINRTMLKKAMFKTNLLSYSFIVTFFLISKFTKYNLI
jgi:hypothetical protein